MILGERYVCLPLPVTPIAIVLGKWSLILLGRGVNFLKIFLSEIRAFKDDQHHVRPENRPGNQIQTVVVIIKPCLRQTKSIFPKLN
jgi:hypothetical protein